LRKTKFTTMLTKLEIIEMSQKNIITTIAIIILIFLVGFLIRVETTGLSGIPSDEKAFYEDQNGLPYMYELDSYYNYRLTENYLDHGYLGDAVINGTEWDLHSYYPPGRSAEYSPLIIYLAALFYKLANIFTNTPLIVVCFWLTSFIAPLAGIITYLFVRRFTNEYGAVTAGLLTITIPFYFIRTIPGWFDTDMFNVLFPILIMWFIAEAVSAKNTTKRILFTFAAAFSTFLFSIAWEGWTYVFYIVVFSVIIYIILSKFMKFKIKNVIQVLGVFMGLTILFIIIPNISNILVFTFPFQFIQANTTSWPDIYISVGEMGNASFGNVFSDLGFTFLAGIFGLLWTFRIMINKKLKEQYLDKFTWFFLLLLVLWSLIGFSILTQGKRFIMILIPPFVVSSGMMVGICVEYYNILKKSKKFSIFQKKNFIKLISIGTVILVAFPGILNDYGTFSTFIPGADDDIWTASQWISNNTSNNTVIISEWSYGHFFTAIADRHVSVDGGSQNSPRTYWIYRAFETDNDSLSLGIFKMIATTGDLGYLTIDNYTKNSTKTSEILNNILGINKKEALTVLTNKYNLSSQEAQNILNYTHPSNPQPFVLVTTNNMINKGYWTFYFGSWDFNKLQGEDFTYTFGNITINGDTLNSSNGILMNMNTKNTTWNGEIPYSVTISNNSKIEKYYLDKNSDFSIILNINSSKSIVITKDFENSLFTKLVIERSNSTNFKPIYINNNVIVWKST
jgi:Uncharacterized membrane protein, required for N-linked glycosylation